MKHLFMTIAMAAAVTACGHRASTAEGTDADSISVDSTNVDVAAADTLRTDSIAKEYSDSTAHVLVSAEWPVDGEKALVASIRRYICEELAIDVTTDEEHHVNYTDDGKKLVAGIASKQFKDLSGMWYDAKKEGYGGDMVYDFLLRTWKLEETDTYVTYMRTSEGYTGGAHGYFLAAGKTFRKSDGKSFGYKMEYNRATEKFDITEQTLFKKSSSPQLYRIIKEGAKRYFKDCEVTITNDEELAENLQVEDVNRIPLPSSPPYFTKDGLCFTYQQYEIACYAVGLVSFTVTYDKIRPLLTEEAAALIPSAK